MSFHVVGIYVHPDNGYRELGFVSVNLEGTANCNVIVPLVMIMGLSMTLLKRLLKGSKARQTRL